MGTGGVFRITFMRIIRLGTLGGSKPERMRDGVHRDREAREDSVHLSFFPLSLFPSFPLFFVLSLLWPPGELRMENVSLRRSLPSLAAGR